MMDKVSASNSILGRLEETAELEAKLTHPSDDSILEAKAVTNGPCA
jgi:hypothetical protein